jgi:hypothetical protein
LPNQTLPHTSHEVQQFAHTTLAQSASKLLDV